MAPQWLTLDHAAVGVADFDAERVEDHDRVHAIQRPRLPFAELVQHGIGDTADQAGDS
jgi:hypothetical protein